MAGMVWTLVKLDALYDYKERSGLPWDAIARKLGVTHGAVYCWRVGRTVPPVEKQRRMAELFGEAPTGSRPVRPAPAAQPNQAPSTTIEPITEPEVVSVDLTADIALLCGPSVASSQAMALRFMQVVARSRSTS